MHFVCLNIHQIDYDSLYKTHVLREIVLLDAAEILKKNRIKFVPLYTSWLLRMAVALSNSHRADFLLN